MQKIKYLFRILSGVRLKKLTNVIGRVQERCGKSKIFIFFDMLVCAVRYGAGYHDYLIFAFYNMNAKQRKTYVTRVSNKKINSLCNDPAYSYIFDKKNVFNKRFRDYLKRDFVDLAETDLDAFKTFMADKDIIFAKPNTAESGKGIERLKKEDFASLEEMFEYVKDPAKNFGVLEEQIIQHEDLARLYPCAVNTLRIVTLARNGEVFIPYAVCKMGNEGKFVDNMENSGLACPIDIETSCIRGVAHTSALINFDVHPYTGIKLVGYHLPYVHEALELCKKAALEVPQIGHVGWDVCITPDGPAIIEGNDFPGYDFYQLPEHTPEKIGLLPFYKEHIPEL